MHEHCALLHLEALEHARHEATGRIRAAVEAAVARHGPQTFPLGRDADGRSYVRVAGGSCEVYACEDPWRVAQETADGGAANALGSAAAAASWRCYRGAARLRELARWLCEGHEQEAALRAALLAAARAAEAREASAAAPPAPERPAGGLLRLGEGSAALEAAPAVGLALLEGEEWAAGGLLREGGAAPYLVEAVGAAPADGVTLRVRLGGEEVLRRTARRPRADGLFAFRALRPTRGGAIALSFEAPGLRPLELRASASAAGLAAGRAAPLGDLRACAYLGARHAATRQLDGLPAPEPEDSLRDVSCDGVDACRRLLLAIACALPRGALDGAVWGDELREAWENHVASASCAEELCEALVALQRAVKAEWTADGWREGARAAQSDDYLLRTATPAALAARVFLLDKHLRYEKQHAPQRRAPRQAAPAAAPARRGRPPKKRRRPAYREDSESESESEEDADAVWARNARAAASTSRRRAAPKSYKEWSSGDEDGGGDGDEDHEEEEEDAMEESDGERAAVDDVAVEGDVRSDAVNTTGFHMDSWIGRAQVAVARLRLQDIAIPFDAPVDTRTYSDYLDHVDEPMDLSTIARRLHNKEYGSVEEVRAAVDLVRRNCHAYNGDSSLISQHADAVVSKFDRFIKD